MTTIEEKINKLQEQLDELREELKNGYKEPVAGELAIFWNYTKSYALIHYFKDKDNAYFIDVAGIRWRNAILFESKEQFKTLINS